MWFVLCLFGALFALAYYRLGVAREWFRVSVRSGELLVVHGRIPRELLHDFSVILARTASCEVVALRSAGLPALHIEGALDAAAAQRLRNVFGLYTAPQLARAPLVRAPNLGQRLAITWLAWLLKTRQRK